MSRKRNAANLKLTDPHFKGNGNAARNVGFQRINPFGTGFQYIAPATRIAKAQSEKYRIKKK